MTPNSTSGFRPKRSENTFLYNDLYANVFSSNIRNSYKPETIQIPLSGE